MNEPMILPALNTPALDYATDALRKRGIRIADGGSPEVTHLLLPVPWSEPIEPALQNLSPTVTIIGGNLNLPDRPCIDLLKDEGYLAKNAMITAHIAMNLAFRQLPVVAEECPVLVVGWGRIGKCLCKLLQGAGAEVTIAARKDSARAMAETMGCKACQIHTLKYMLRRFRIIFNTVPCPVLNQEQMCHCRSDCVKMDLASTSGMPGEDIITARGLPGKYAPESSGRLIADTIVRLLAKEVVS